MNYAQKVTSTLVLAGAALLSGCQSAYHKAVCREERTYQKAGMLEKVKHIEGVLEAYDKDGALNPSANPTEDEVLGTFKQKERISALRPAVAKESKELEGRLASADQKAESYLTRLANSDQVTGYIVLVTQRKNAGASVRVYGLNENDHMALTGTLATHVAQLGLNRDEQIKKSPSTAGQKFGYQPSADLSEKIGEIRAATTHVDKTMWKTVAGFIPATGLKTKSGDSISKAEYELMLTGDEVVDVRIVHLITPAEKKEEPKAPEKK